ncbi:MAG: uroporphyrinogen decarboxylase family protein, partial [Nocardioidaceae bacterium]
APALESVAAAVHDAGSKAIVHCCAREVPFGLLAKVGFDGVGVDLDQIDAPAYDALAGLLESKALVHLGVVATHGPVPDAKQVAARVERFLDVLGLEPTPGLVLAPACGLAGRSPAEARATLDLVSRAAKAL